MGKAGRQTRAPKLAIERGSPTAPFLWPGYGMVFRAKDERTGEVVAIKKIERSLVDDYVEQECLNLARCQHNQIIQFIEVRQPVTAAKFWLRAAGGWVLVCAGWIPREGGRACLPNFSIHWHLLHHSVDTRYYLEVL
jgi:hypothetical protein